MAKSILEYWDGSAWIQAKTVNAATNAADQNNAVIGFSIKDKLNNPRTANIRLINAGREPFGSGANRYSPLNDVFTDFMTIRIVEDDSKVTLFQGKIYDVYKNYDMQWGSVIKLYARDNLAELADYPTDDKDEPISSTDSDRNSVDRSDIIKTIIRDTASEPHMASLMISSDNIAIDDTQKFDDSSRTFSHDGETYEFVVSSGGKQGLKAIGKIAANDGHNAGEVSDYGYDFYVDTQQALGASNPAMDFNYFKRGSRTTWQGTAANFDGLTAEYPVAAFTETGNKTMMMPGFDFNQPKKDLYTGAIVHIPWNTEGENDKTTTDNRALEIEVLEGNISSEFLHAKDNSTNAWKLKALTRSNDTVTAPENFADYLWKLGAQVDTGARLNGAISDTATEALTVEMTAGSGTHTIQAGDVIMITTGGNSENMYVREATQTNLKVVRAWGTAHSSYSTAVAHSDEDTIYKHNIVGRLQYQSTNSGEGFILISFERDTAGSKIINTQRKNFEAIATGGSDITLTNGNDHFVFNPSTERVANKWGLKRLLRVSESEAKNLNNLRKNLAASLNGSKTTRTECTITTMPPPFIYHETYAASAASTTQIVLADSSANRNAFDIGLRNGMTIAKVNSVGVQTAYGYVTAIADTDSNTATVTAALNTGNWSGYTGSGNKLRFYIPIRAGHYIYAKNTLVNFEGYMFLQEITYTEEAGVQATHYKGTGVNSAGNTISTGLDPNVIVATIEGESGKLMEKSSNPPKGSLGFKFRPTTDTGTAIFTGSDRDTMAWTAGELVVGQQSRYPITAGDTGNMSTSADAITGYPPLYVIYFDPDQVPTANGRYAFSSSVESSYNADADHIFIGHTRAAHVATGKAIFVRDGSGMGFFGGNDGVGEGAFSAALFKKSTQPYTTNINIYPGNSSLASKFRYVHATSGVAGSTTDGTISFADDSTVVLTDNISIDLGTADHTVSYVYFKLVDSGGTEASETKDVVSAVIEVTTDYAVATSESRGLLAICSTGDVSDTDSEVAIQAFHGKGQNITADVIAANAITATAIKSGTVTTKMTADMTGVTMNTSGHIYSGSKAYGDNNTGFIIDGGTSDGRIQIGPNNGNNLKWTGSALEITGGGTFSGALSAATGSFTGSVSVGKIVINTDGIKITANADSGTAISYLQFAIADGTVKASQYFIDNRMIINQGADNTVQVGQRGATGGGLRPHTGGVEILGFTNLSSDANYTNWYKWPNTAPSSGQVLTYAGTNTTADLAQSEVTTIRDLVWATPSTAATTVTVTNSTANTNFPVVFHDESNGLLDDTGAFTFNPSTGLIITTGITASGTVTFGSLSDGAITITAWINEDNMSTDSATRIPTQSSVKAYVDAGDASARGLKDNIENLTLDTERIFKLTPRTFTWKNNDSIRVGRQGKQSFGYIADEVQDVLPEIVGYDKENDPRTVDYKLLSVLLLEEVKKLRTRVDNLEAG